MGAYLAHPITKTNPEEGQGNRLEYGASSMQGWRISQEDAHNCLVDFDVDSSFFAVYDGHGGSEVATYLSHHLPELLKSTESYKTGNWKEALREAYLQIDESIKTPEVLKEIVRLSKFGKKTEEKDNFVYENVNELYEEATMPIEMLVAKYQEGEDLYISNKLIVSKLQGRLMEKAGSSKKLPLDVVSGDVETGLSSPSKSKKSEITNEVLDVDKTRKEDEVQVISEPNKEEPMDISTISSGSRSDTDDVKNGDVETPEELREKSKSESTTLNNTDTDQSVKMNGQVESGDAETIFEKESCVIANGLLENGSIDGVSVADSKENDQVISNVREESIIVAPKKKKGKMHQPPILQLPKSESSPEKRTSPRKNTEKVYIDFLKGESTSEDSDDEDDPVTLDVIHSDSEESDESEDLNSSTDEKDEEEDEEAEVEEEVDDSEDDEMLKDYQEPGYDSGATAVAAFAKWEGNKLHLWVGNAGDSRCVVSRDGKALEMSEDHKPEDEREALRIVTAGGKVTNEGRVNGGLNLSRAIGDHSYKTNPTLRLEDQMITSLPDVEYAELNPDTDKFIILACDGIWNSMTSQQVIDFVSERISDPMKKLSTICEELFNTCLSPDTAGDGTGCDNMTAIIVRVLGKDELITPVSTKCQVIEEVRDEGLVVVGSPVVDTSDEPEQPKKSSGLKRPLNGSPTTSPTPGSEEVKRLKIDSENP